MVYDEDRRGEIQKNDVDGKFYEKGTPSRITTVTVTEITDQVNVCTSRLQTIVGFIRAA